MEKLSIPHITDEELMRRYLKIRPVVRIGEVKYWLRDYSINQLRTFSSFMVLVFDKRGPVGDALSCHDYHDFECLHSFGHYGLFISIAEVLAQIPEEALNHFTIDAFEIIDIPTSSSNLTKYRKALEQGFHVSVVRLYIRPEP